MQKVVGVKFRLSNKVYYFSPKNNEYNFGDEVIVDTTNGLALGTVSKANFELENNIEEPIRDVLRKVGDTDKIKIKEYEEKSKKVLPEVEKIVSKIGLVMKIVDVEYAFEGNKIIISFTADGRIDFRELLKELASTLRLRIELRQIGNRDEVQNIGGIGPCGRECCCTKFGSEPEHVSVKMAKNQGLSLSPTKINGLCGRLMCCLAYEDPTYKDILQKMPRLNSLVKTPDGEGKVLYNEVLKQRVSVKVFGKDDSYKINTYDLCEIEMENINNSFKNEKKIENNKVEDKKIVNNIKSNETVKNEDCNKNQKGEIK